MAARKELNCAGTVIPELLSLKQRKSAFLFPFSTELKEGDIYLTSFNYDCLLGATD